MYERGQKALFKLKSVIDRDFLSPKISLDLFDMEAGYGHYRVIALSRYRLVHNAITRQRDNATTR